MSFDGTGSNHHNARPPVRVDHSYENEFCLVTSSAVLAFISFGLLVTCVMPNLPWAYVATTTGLEQQGNTTTFFFPVTIEAFSLWDFSCSTPGMEFTYGGGQDGDGGLCNTMYQVVEAFSTLACVFSILGLVFGIMPFSPVAPREPKQALTNSMMSHLLAGLFALVSWSVFYGGLVFGVWRSPSQENILSHTGVTWENNVIVTSGGILAVTGWVGAFLAWVLALSAMIKYDPNAAQQAILKHHLRKQRRAKKKQEMIQRLGEGAFRAAHDKESIPLELGDKLYFGGTVAAGGTAAVAWGNMSIVPYLFLSPYALPVVAGVFSIGIAVACTTGALVLLVGLTDLIPRPKASVGGFAVFCTVAVAWCSSFGMTIHFITTLEETNVAMLSLEAAIGTLGMACAVCTMIVLYHPFRIWEKDFRELPRPAKIHAGDGSGRGYGLALVMTSAACALVGFCLCMASITVFTMTGSQFVALPLEVSAATQAPTTTSTGDDTCLNTQGSTCNIGPAEQRCCPAPFACVEVSFTKYTCQFVPEMNHFVGIRDAFTVGQAFLGLTIGFSAVAYVFAALALCPNGVMDVKVALSVSTSTGVCAFVCSTVAFAVLQGYVLSNGGQGMPIECGFLLGCFAVELGGSVLSMLALRAEYRQTKLGEPQSVMESAMLAAQRELELEKTKLEVLLTRRQRIAVERELGQDTTPRNNGDNDEEEDEDEQPAVTASELQVV